jgi:iron complex transport system substrate-binding protein
MPRQFRSSPLPLTLLLGALVLTFADCDRDRVNSVAATTQATRPITKPTVASLSPAATDLLIGMGAGDHLIAVSNYDAENPQTKDLPRVGDYRTIDRERLTTLKPDLIVLQGKPEKIQPGTAEFITGSLHARMVNIQIVTLADVFDMTQVLGEAVGTPDRAKAAANKLRTELDAVKQGVAGKPPVRVYVARSGNGLDSVGGGNFVDDVLTIAGGTNVLSGGQNSFPTVDREQLIKLDPDVILHLLPGASPQAVARAKEFWAGMEGLRAVKAGRVYVLEEYYVLQPSYRLGDTARLFAERLHGGAAKDVK